MSCRFSMTAVTAVLTLIMTASSGYAAPFRIGSITEKVKSPAHVAVDGGGNVYVTETTQNQVNVYDRKGRHQKSISVKRPLGIAIDGTGNIYVGSETRKSVEVYNTEHQNTGSIGAGEITKPNSIAIDNGGRIYVADTLSDVVRVYEPTGETAIKIGGTGSASGLFNRPTAVAVNETAQEIYVSDLQQSGTGSGQMNTARIQAFDKNGAYKRSFGQYGVNVGQIKRPVDLATDSAGNLYVVDVGQGAVHIMDPASGATTGALYDMTAPLKTPLGVAVAGNKTAYITSNNNKSVDIYALDGYTTLETDPKALSFQTRQLSPAGPENQTIVITNTGSGTLNWTAAADKAWLTLGQTTGAASPNTSVGLLIGVNASSLGAATHTGNVTITADGLKDTIPVTLTVLPAPVLSLSNGWLTYSTKKGKSPAAQQVTINIQNAATDWSAASSDPGIISISPSAGSVTTTAGISINAAGLPTGSHTGYITFTAPNAVGNGSKLTISITVSAGNKISVSTNKQEAKYTVKGPETYTGSGTSWTKEDVPAGEYTITYEQLAGHQRPLPQTKKLTEDGETAFTGTYETNKDLAAKRNIITAKGPSKKNDSEVKAYRADGAATTPQYSLKALETAFGANIAVADIDGDGTAELITAAGPGETNAAHVRIYGKDKTKMIEFTPYDGMNGANIAAADLNADGRAELIVAPGPGETNPGTVTVYAYDKDKKEMIKTGIGFAAHDGYYGAVVGSADTRGDQRPEIITAPGSKEDADKNKTIKIWTIDATKGMGNWTAEESKEITVNIKHEIAITGGDTDGDGKDEIIIAGREPQGDDSAVRILKLQGTEYKESKKITIAGEHRITAAAADLDGDGAADIIIGTDAKKEEDEEEDDDEDGKTKKDDHAKNKADDKKEAKDHKKAKVTIYYSASGTQKDITPYDETKKGINVAAGAMGIQ